MVRIFWHKWNQQPVKFSKSKLMTFLTNVLSIHHHWTFHSSLYNVSSDRFFLWANVYSKISLEAFRIGGQDFGWIRVLDVLKWSYNRHMLVQILSSLVERYYCLALCTNYDFEFVGGLVGFALTKMYKWTWGNQETQRAEGHYQNTTHAQINSNEDV